jgi:hypothetical protein
MENDQPRLSAETDYRAGGSDGDGGWAMRQTSKAAPMRSSPVERAAVASSASAASRTVDAGTV